MERKKKGRRTRVAQICLVALSLLADVLRGFVDLLVGFGEAGHFVLVSSHCDDV